MTCSQNKTDTFPRGLLWPCTRRATWSLAATQTLLCSHPLSEPQRRATAAATSPRVLCKLAHREAGIQALARHELLQWLRETMTASGRELRDLKYASSSPQDFDKFWCSKTLWKETPLWSKAICSHARQNLKCGFPGDEVPYCLCV